MNENIKFYKEKYLKICIYQKNVVSLRRIWITISKRERLLLPSPHQNSGKIHFR